jgi:competence protein ComFC
MIDFKFKIIARLVASNLFKRSERKMAVKGLYELNELVKNDLSTIEEKNVLLIDDMVTTGFTVSECSQILKTAGVKTVNILTVGRSYYKT